jgi:hypothetical protein
VRSTTTTAGSKRCLRCGQTLPLEQFYRNVRAPDGRTRWCAACCAEAVRRARRRPDAPQHVAVYLPPEMVALLEEAARLRESSVAGVVYCVLERERRWLLQQATARPLPPDWNMTLSLFPLE